MELHRYAKLGLAGRLALVRAIEDGASLKKAASALDDLEGVEAPRALAAAAA